MKGKSEIRDEVWSRMEEENVARFPTPVEGRIPNFVGAEKAVYKSDDIEAYRNAEKINGER